MFLNAVMLAGLSAAVLPIVLHLLNRARYRKVEWGAMMFLHDTETRQLDRSKLAQYLLLLLRILAIATIALAFARPISRNAIGPTDAQRLAVVIVIDSSPSMLHPEQAATRFDQARRASLGVLGQLKRGDQIGLVVLGRPSDRDIPLTTDLQDVASQLASLEPALSVADQADGVRRARALLTVAGSIPSEIFLIGDRQRSAWRNIESISPPDAQRQRIVAIPVGSTENANAWIESISIPNAPTIAGQTVEVELRIRNDGTVSRNDLPVTISENEKPIETRNIYLAAGATEIIRVPIKLPKPGDMLLTASIGASGMPGDDAAMLSVDVLETVRVVAITGESSQQIAKSPAADYSGDTDYLRLALTPLATSRQKGDDAFRFKLYSDDNWPEIDPQRDRVIVLSDVSHMDAARVRTIEQFVFAGGGLLLAPGQRTDPKIWNQLLYRDGQGVAPAGIQAIRVAGEDTIRLVGINTSHEVFGFYAGRPDPLPPVTVFRWAQFADPPQGATLASLQNGDAFILQRTYGRGRVVAIATALDADWSNFALSNLYLPTMQSMGCWLASANLSSHNVASGGAIEYTFDNPKERGAMIVRPDGRTDKVPISIAGGTGTLIYPDTNIAGRYTVRAPGHGAVDFVVQASGEESILDLLNDEQLDAMLAPTTIQPISPDQLTDAVGRMRKSTELSLVLLTVGLALLGAEMLLAQRSIPTPEVA